MTLGAVLASVTLAAAGLLLVIAFDPGHPLFAVGCTCGLIAAWLSFGRREGRHG